MIPPGWLVAQCASDGTCDTLLLSDSISQLKHANTSGVMKKLATKKMHMSGAKC